MDPIKPSGQPGTVPTEDTDAPSTWVHPNAEGMVISPQSKPVDSINPLDTAPEAVSTSESQSTAATVADPTPSPAVPQDSLPASTAAANAAPGPVADNSSLESAGATAPSSNTYQPTVFAPTVIPPAPTVTDSTQSAPVTPSVSAPTAYNPANTAEGIVVGSHAAVPTTPQQPKSKKKKLLFGGVLAAVVVLVGGGAIFGLYLPSRPENVFNRGLERTGTAMNTLVTEATDTATQAKYKSDSITGKFELDSDSMGKATATVEGQTSSTAVQVDAKVSWTQADAPAQEYGAKFLSSIPSGKKYPNVYIQPSGFKTFVAGTEFEQYDGKWLFLSSEYLESLAQSYGESTTKQENITTADVSAFAKDMNKVAQEYVFTADTTKAVLENRGYKGKEEIEGIKTNRYTVGINVANAKKLCAATADVAFDSQLFKKQLSDASARAEEKASFLKTCQESAGKTKTSDTFDMWIGGKYGLIRKIRITDDKNKSDYIEFGQSYNGGDVITVYANTHLESDQNTNFHIAVINNTKTGEITLDVTGKGTDTDSKFTLSGKVSAVPTKTAPNITEPAGAVDVQKLLEQFQQSAAASQAQADANRAEAQALFEEMSAENQ